MKRICLCLMLAAALSSAEPQRHAPTIRSLQFRKLPKVQEKEVLRMLRAKGIGVLPEAPLDREQLDEARLIISELIEAHGSRGYHVVTTVKDAGNRSVEVIFTAVKK
ncbi:MAG: hypothetical protein HY820_35900 [Acidobacteria bacterium]|nr:hypothetical protein [Acidobacteriota bacterium]